MPKVRAKMYVAEVARYAYNPEATKVTLQVVSQGEENKAWAAATPTGSMTLTINAKTAADLLADQLGQEVFIDIIPAGDFPPDGPTDPSA